MMLVLRPVFLMFVTVTLVAKDAVGKGATTTSTTDVSRPTGGSPYIMVHPANQTVVMGQRLVLPCETEAYPQQITYTWFKDGKDVQTSHGYKAGRIKIPSDGSLLIMTTVKEDRGWYKCRPSNGLGFDEASAYINVIYRPHVIDQAMLSQITWAKGRLQQLDCPVDSNPAISAVTWDKDQVEVEKRGRFDILTNGTLLVSNVEPSDAGAYRCTPYNMVGRGSSSKRVQVIVRDPPTFSVRPDSGYVLELGESVIMNCSASGTPNPSVMWRKENGVLDIASPRITEGAGYLEIKNLQKEDHGKYECVAANTVATIVTVTQLRVQNTTPHAPYNITVEAGLFDAHIRWKPGYNGGKTQRYILWFRKAGAPQWLTMPVDAHVMNYDLYNLNPDTEYEFKIMSRNSLGKGAFSDPVKAKTMGYEKGLMTTLPTNEDGVTYFPDVMRSLGPKPPPPANLSASVSDRAITLNWIPPSVSPVPIIYYRIQYRFNGDEWLQHPARIRDQSTSSIVLEDMKYGRYDIFLQSYSLLAFSTRSNIIVVNLDDDDMVLPEALIGGIIGGILFLLVAVLLALVAIFHSRKKERKSKNKKFNDISYGKPDEVNGRPHQHPSQRDRWMSDGGRNLMTSAAHTDHSSTMQHDNGVFFLPQTRHMDTTASMAMVGEGRPRPPKLHNEDIKPKSFPDSSLSSNITHSNHHRNDQIDYPHSDLHHPHPPPHHNHRHHQNFHHEVPLTSLDHHLNHESRSRSKSQPASLRYRGSGGTGEPSSNNMNKNSDWNQPDPAINAESHNRSVPSTFTPHRQSHPDFSKSYSFPSLKRPISSNTSASQPFHTPDKVDNLHSHPSHHHHHHPHPHRNSSGSSSRHPSSLHSQQQQQQQHPHLSTSHHPSVPSEDDDVFNNSSTRFPPPPSLHRPQRYHNLPRHSSMIPNREANAYPTEFEPSSASQLNPPMFGVEDISSVLDPPSEQPSQNQPTSSTNINSLNASAFSPNTHPASTVNEDTLRSNISQLSAFYKPHDSAAQPPLQPQLQPQQQHQQTQRLASENDDSNTSSSGGRGPRSYTRDQLQDVVQRLRQRPMERSHPAQHNMSGFSEPLPPRPSEMYHPHNLREFSSQPELPNPNYHNQRNSYNPRYGNRGRPLYRGGHHYGNQPLPGYDDTLRPRALSEGTRGSYPPFDQEDNNNTSFRRSPSFPDIPTHQYRAPSQYDPTNSLVPNVISPHSYHPSHYVAPAHPNQQPFHSETLPLRPPGPHFRGDVPPNYNANPYPYQYDPEGPQRRHPADEAHLLDTTTHSSGIGSRNTSQSAPMSYRGKTSTSLSSGLDPDLSLDTTTTPGQNNRRDTSVDENYEFDSINALERDIMSDLKRYSQLSSGFNPSYHRELDQHSNRRPSDGESNTTLSSSFSPPKPPRPGRYAGEDPNLRFERLREEFKQYRQQQQQQHYGHLQTAPAKPQHYQSQELSTLQQQQQQQQLQQRLPMDSDML